MKTPTLRILALALCLAALAGLRCGGSSDAPGPGGPTVTTIGDETLVVLSEGSLSAARPTSDAERFQALADYVRDHPELFGPDTPTSNAPTFVRAELTLEPAGVAAHVTGPTGEAWILLALRQTVLGAPVVDEILMGGYVETPEGGMLRRVRGRVRDPATLPMPPDPGTAPRDRVLPVANDLIFEHGLSFDRTNVGDDPVVSAKHGIAGYPVSQFRPTGTESFDVFEAIVDPRDLRVVLREIQPGCDSCVEVPVGVVVAETIPDYPVFTPGRSIRIHAVRLADDDGSNQAPITRAEVKIWVDATNQVWWPQAGLYFAFDATTGSADFVDVKSTLLNTVPTDSAESASYKQLGNIWSLMVRPDKLVVYFRASTGPGWSWGPTSTFFISMPSYTNTALNKPGEGGWIRNDTALSHEIGHYMGLAHTFGGAACVDAVPSNSNGDVNGQDGSTTDDDVLDTNPDMRDACYPTPSLTCTGGAVFWNGHSWTPPWANVMSYHDCLPEELTEDQLAAIERTLLHPARANLLVD